MRKLSIVFVTAGAFALVACGSDKKTTDGGVPGKDIKVVKKDGGGTPAEDMDVSEGILLPDKGPGRDGVIAGDGPSTFDCDRTRIGKPCKRDLSNPNTPAPECGEKASCLVTDDDGSGVCTCECEPDNPQTPFTNEDKCGEGGGAGACGLIELSNGSEAGFCFQTCQPELGKNACTAPLVCNPRTAGILGEPVCVIPGCSSGDECPGTTGESTDGTGFCKTDDAASCPAGQKCLALTSGNTLGVCTEPGTCDTASGLCGKHPTTKPTSAIGDTCKSDRDCAEYQSCELEMDRKGVLGQKEHGEACQKSSECCGGCNPQTSKCEGSCMVHARNGYCMISGCAFATATAWKEFACPTGSACNAIFAGGFCMKECDLKQAATCRGNAADQWGDYECRAYNNFGQGAYVKVPVCDFGDMIPCTIFAASQGQTDCSALGIMPGNDTNMACRNPQTKEKTTNVYDPMGYCLDDTASAPDA